MIQGAIAGFVATAPMTWAMEVLFRRLPHDDRYPLPPRQITMKVTQEAGVKDELTHLQRHSLTLLSHFGYGAASGMLYSQTAARLPVSPLTKGVAYGIAVWAASYTGFLPALGILKPVRRQPVSRTALMVAVHLVWGAATGLAMRAMSPNMLTAFNHRPELETRDQKAA